MTEFIGRRVSVGVGNETTRGTAVAPSYWFRHLSLSFGRKTTAIQNESAMGRVEKINDSAIVSQWAEGQLEGKVTDIGVGYLLANIFGTVNSQKKADDATVYEHSFTINQLQTPPTMTIARKDPNSDRRHALGTLSQMELSVEAGDWVKVNCDILAKMGTDTSNTVAFIEENEFTSRNLSVKMANDEAGLATAAPVACKSFKITINRNANTYLACNDSIDITDIHTGAYELTGEMVLIYTNQDWENKYYNNTAQAMEVSIENKQVQISTKSHPGIKIKAPKVRVSEWSTSNDLDAVIEQTLSFSIELDATKGKAIEAVLTNTKANYNA